MSEHFAGTIRRRTRMIATASLVAVLAMGATSASAASAPWSNPVPVAVGDIEATVVAPNGDITSTLVLEAGIFTVTSTDAGATWGTPVAVGSAGDYSAFRSAIGVTSSGLLAVSWVEIVPPFTKTIHVATSADGGATWSTPTQLPTVDTDADDPVLASTGADAFTLVWSEGFAKRASATTDGGATWSAPVVITEFMNSYGVASLVPTGANGIVVIFQEFDGLLAEYSIQSRRSTDGGATWAPKVAVAPAWSGTLGGTIYAVGVSPASGSVVAGWTRGLVGNHEALFAAASTDGGSTWGSTIEVSGPVDSIRYFRVQTVSPTTAGFVWHHYLGAAQVLAYATVDLGAASASTPAAITSNDTGTIDKLPSLSAIGDTRVVTWLNDAESPESGYYGSVSCDGGTTWSAPADLVLDEEISTEDAVAVVSGGVVTGLWSVFDGTLGQSNAAASSAAAPCTPLGAAPAAPAALARTGASDTVAVAALIALLMFGLGAGIIVKRTRQA